MIIFFLAALPEPLRTLVAGIAEEIPQKFLPS
jgi:hypothetical protein